MKYYVALGSREIGVEVHHTEHGIVLRPVDPESGLPDTTVDFAAVHANVDTGEGLYSIIANGKSYQLYVEPHGKTFQMGLSGKRFDAAVLTEREWRLQKVAPRQATHSGAITVIAPMPGLVKSVLVAVGDEVTAGQRILVLEAMKMENDITAPAAGKVSDVKVTAGAIVEGGKPLVSIDS
jgi:glutaconyl-CoA/methylmalonyl-CoA decarboxylase subunit gamma